LSPASIPHPSPRTPREKKGYQAYLDAYPSICDRGVVTSFVDVLC